MAAGESLKHSDYLVIEDRTLGPWKVGPVEIGPFRVGGLLSKSAWIPFEDQEQPHIAALGEAAVALTVSSGGLLIARAAQTGDSPIRYLIEKGIDSGREYDMRGTLTPDQPIQTSGTEVHFRSGDSKVDVQAGLRTIASRRVTRAYPTPGFRALWSSYVDTHY